MIQIMIDNGAGLFIPTVCGGVTWSLERQGVPGKLEFSMLYDPSVSFEEGNRVSLFMNGNGLFYGYMFERKRGKEGKISVTAYDQLRYLKNKDTYCYEDQTASEVIRMIAADFNLTTGEVADTEFKIVSRSEPDKTLFDIILTALDLTMAANKEMYVLYDSYGKLTLKNIGDMRLDNLCINDAAAEDYDYSVSIDGETYNQIKVSIDNEETGKRDIYMTKDSANIGAWGVLQYYYKAEKGDNGQVLAEQMLAKYNRKTRKLSVKGAFGDIRVRAGTLIPVFLNLGDMETNRYMVVEKVSHTWEGVLHTMDLTLRGCDFIA